MTERAARTGHRRRWLEPILSLLAFAGIHGIMRLLHECDWNLGLQRGAVLAGLLALAALNRCRAPAAVPPDPAGAARTPWVLLSIAASVWLTGYALHYAPVSTPADIGRSTITTARYLFESGLNPYATPVDMDAGPIGTGFHFFNGYKYFPLTLCFNYPFVLAFGRNGIYIANYLLTIACLAALLVLGRDLFTGAPPHIALALTATSPFLLHELFRQGVNDMLPIACTVASVALLQRRHCGAAGLALGLGMSAKYMPGLLAAPLLLIAARRRARFLIACTAPMLLIVGPFILMAPKEFTGSIILYYLGQTPDSTSVLFFLPPALQHIWPVLGLAVLAFIHAAFLVRTVIYRKHTGEAGGLLLHLCLAIGAACLFTKVNHRNYLMWPLPFLALCLGDLGTTLAALTPWRRGRHERSDTT